MEPVIKALQNEFKDKVRFIIVDVENTSDPTLGKMNDEFNVRYIPSFFIIDKKGKKVFDHVGTMDEEDLRSKLLKITQ